MYKLEQAKDCYANHRHFGAHKEYAFKLRTLSKCSKFKSSTNEGDETSVNRSWALQVILMSTSAKIPIGKALKVHPCSNPICNAAFASCPMDKHIQNYLAPSMPLILGHAIANTTSLRNQHFAKIILHYLVSCEHHRHLCCRDMFILTLPGNNFPDASVATYV